MKMYAVEISEKRGAIQSVEAKLRREYGGDSFAESLYRFLKECFKEISEIVVKAGTVIIKASEDAVNQIAEKICNVLRQRCTTGVEVKVEPFEEPAAATA